MKDAYYIAVSGDFHTAWGTQDSVGDVVGRFAYLVGSSDNPTIRGLLSTMTEELQNGRRCREMYLGGDSPEEVNCVGDARVLLARVLAENSQDGGISYAHRFLQRMASDEKIKGQTCGDPFENWLFAQRRFVRGGIEKLKGIAAADD